MHTRSAFHVTVTAVARARLPRLAATKIPIAKEKVVTIVKQSRIPNAGLGLFSGQRLEFGREIVHQSLSVEVRKCPDSDMERIKGEVRSLGHPDDSIIWVECGSAAQFAYHDREVFEDTCPHWYRMNHSESPNVRMKLVSGRVTFVALRDIELDEELLWDYGGVPKGEVPGPAE